MLKRIKKALLPTITLMLTMNAYSMERPVKSSTLLGEGYGTQTFLNSSNLEKTKNGAKFPLESTLLVLRDKASKNIIMSWSERKGKEKEWSLIGGKIMSIAPGETDLTDYIPSIDSRYIVNGNQISEKDQSNVIYENPKLALARELMEELTGQKNIDEFMAREFEWITNKILVGNWTILKADKKVIYDEQTGEVIKKFSTLTCVCLVDLNNDEVDYLNNQIQKYTDREHLYFKSHPWELKSVIEKDKSVEKFAVNVKEGKVRKYLVDIMFKFYKKQFAALLNYNN